MPVVGFIPVAMNWPAIAADAIETDSAEREPRGMSEEEARRRIAVQMPVEEKLKFATEKIDCSGSIESTRRQVEALAERICSGGRTQ